MSECCSLLTAYGLKTVKPWPPAVVHNINDTHTHECCQLGKPPGIAKQMFLAVRCKPSPRGPRWARGITSSRVSWIWVLGCPPARRQRRRRTSCQQLTEAASRLAVGCCETPYHTGAATVRRESEATTGTGSSRALPLTGALRPASAAMSRRRSSP